MNIFTQVVEGGCGRFPRLSGDETCLLKKKKYRAIELYFKYGKKLAPVVRELGYPSKRNLRRWIRSWEAGGGAKESIRHKPRYTDEQKQVAVDIILTTAAAWRLPAELWVIPVPMCSFAGLMNVTPTDDVYLPVRPVRLRPLNQKSNVRLSWHSVHDKYQPVKSEITEYRLPCR